MSTVEVGRAAEQQAADYLVAQGFMLVGRNWRNRWCELDIIARRGPVLHFVEVKYRQDVRYGYAAEYISYDKSRRLMRAALAWNQAHSYNGPYQIDVVSVEGNAAAPAISIIENAIGEH
jgi:putative endonuclease